MFQSLFCWIGLFDLHLAINLIGIDIVSILVLLDRSLRHRIVEAQLVDAVMFQSLFCWIGLFDTSSSSDPRYKCSVSILVLLDRSLRRAHRSDGIGRQTEFQSLFCWIGLFDVQRREGWWEQVWGFNPCFVGSVSSTEDPMALKIAHESSFNPCFVGSVSSTTAELLSHGCHLQVSILVLLDRSLRHHLCRITDLPQWCFNPCFVGSVSSTKESVSAESTKLSFNPCFVGSVSSTYNHD